MDRVLSPALARYATIEPSCCCVCRRWASGIGYAPRQKFPIAWVCERPECLQAIKGIYAMRASDLEHLERLALDEGGDAAGAYLDEIGKTDLAELSANEWREFRERFFRATTDALRRYAHEAVAPF